MFARHQTEQLRAGMSAPDFNLVDQNGEQHELGALRGHWVVLYFYPRDDTPGCTKEACGFRDGYPELRALGARIFGLSLDDGDSHRRFADKYSLPFPLLSDSDGEVSRRYGALWSLGPLRFARRHSFIIDPEGRIARIYRKVRPGHHDVEIGRDLRELQL